MKKSLVALAALAVVGAASAQSTVTMYGLIDLSVTNQNDKVTLNGANIDASKNSVKSGVLNGSRIGFKGTEDLGGGLKANFVLEYSVQPDEGSAGTTMANRQSFVGLSGGFGALTIGRQYTPYYSVVGVLDQAGVIDAPGMVVNAHFLGGLRRDNAIQYVSPSFGGVTATVQVAAGNEAAFGTGVANTAAGKSFGGSVVYAAG
ncbi:MAG: porin, partial [Pseudomonadota bacterium]